MGAQVSADEVTLVIVFFLTCGVLISFITDSMLQAIAEKRAQLFGNEDSWEGYAHYGPGPRRRRQRRDVPVGAVDAGGGGTGQGTLD